MNPLPLRAAFPVPHHPEATASPSVLLQISHLCSILYRAIIQADSIPSSSTTPASTLPKGKHPDFTNFPQGVAPGHSLHFFFYWQFNFKNLGYIPIVKSIFLHIYTKNFDFILLLQIFNLVFNKHIINCIFPENGECVFFNSHIYLYIFNYYKYLYNSHMYV